MSRQRRPAETAAPPDARTPRGCRGVFFYHPHLRSVLLGLGGRCVQGELRAVANVARREDSGLVHDRFLATEGAHVTPRTNALTGVEVDHAHRLPFHCPLLQVDRGSVSVFNLQSAPPSFLISNHCFQRSVCPSTPPGARRRTIRCCEGLDGTSGNESRSDLARERASIPGVAASAPPKIVAHAASPLHRLVPAEPFAGVRMVAGWKRHCSSSGPSAVTTDGFVWPDMERPPSTKRSQDK